VNLFAPGPLKGGPLHGGGLVVGAGAGVAVNHGPDMQQTFATCKALILEGFGTVAKLTLYATKRRMVGKSGLVNDSGLGRFGGL
jgi:hypothetical protein